MDDVPGNSASDSTSRRLPSPISSSVPCSLNRSSTRRILSRSLAVRSSHVSVACIGLPFTLEPRDLQHGAQAQGRLLSPPESCRRCRSAARPCSCYLYTPRLGRMGESRFCGRSKWLDAYSRLECGAERPSGIPVRGGFSGVAERPLKSRGPFVPPWACRPGNRCATSAGCWKTTA